MSLASGDRLGGGSRMLGALELAGVWLYAGNAEGGGDFDQDDSGIEILGTSGLVLILDENSGVKLFP